ncbi:MAG: hypothetical protein R2839_11045 [Thermomicrobiales bacterium]
MAPHGWTLIPALCPDAAGVGRTVRAMQELEQRFTTANPDLIVISTPHNVRVEGAICLPRVGRGAGTLTTKVAPWR